MPLQKISKQAEFTQQWNQSFILPFKDVLMVLNLNMMAALALINETITVITISLLLRFISLCRPEPQIARLYKERLGSQK